MKTRLLLSLIYALLLAGYAFQAWKASPFPSLLEKIDIPLFVLVNLVFAVHKALKCPNAYLVSAWGAMSTALFIFTMATRHGGWDGMAMFPLTGILIPGIGIPLHYFERQWPGHGLEPEAKAAQA
jgi:hypothetical protein